MQLDEQKKLTTQLINALELCQPGFLGEFVDISYF